jgi:hypothetical protein
MAVSYGPEKEMATRLSTAAFKRGCYDPLVAGSIGRMRMRLCAKTIPAFYQS